jgi:hypothetical protein
MRSKSHTFTVVGGEEGGEEEEDENEDEGMVGSS